MKVKPRTILRGHSTTTWTEFFDPPPSDAASGWAGWDLAHPEFGSSVNPIPTRGGGDYAHHITASPPRFENLAASLH